jgi:hypothetical protein
MRRPEFRLADYRKASRTDSNPPNCVHIARGLGWAIVRDTKQKFNSSTDHKLAFLAADFDAFQDRVRAADLRTAQIPAGALDGCCISITREAENVNVFRSTIPQPGEPAGVALVYTDGEIEAFFDGVHLHEFDTEGDYIACSVDCAADCALPGHVALTAAAA